MFINMDEKQIRNIIREELSSIFKIDGYVFNKKIQILNGNNIQLGRGLGSKFGTASDQLLAFWGTTPVDQPETVADPSAAEAIYSQANLQEVIDRVKDIIDRLQESGLIK